MDIDPADYILALDLADELDIPRSSLYALTTRGTLKAVTWHNRLMVHKAEAERFRTEYPPTRRRPRGATQTKDGS